MLQIVTVLVGCVQRDGGARAERPYGFSVV